MDKVDITPIVSLFNDFFTLAYKQKIDELLLIYPTHKSINVDYHDLEKFDADLADELVKEPDIVIAAAEQSIKQLNMVLPSGSGPFEPHVRFFNLPNGEMQIEQLSSKEIGELVAFKGVVTKRADVMHRVKLAVYICELCDDELRLVVTKNFVPPKKCPSCKKFALKQMEEESKFVDIQRAEVQELLERVRGGAPTARMELLMEDDLVNLLVPGENIEVVGIMRLRLPLKARNKQDMIYTRYIDVNHVTSMKRDFEEIDISKDDERRILEFSRNSNIEKVMVESVAPAIYGHEEVKRALALQLFGGTKGKKMKGGAPLRDDIHLLLIGDPGLAKCVDGGTNIVLADGSIKKIGVIVDEVLASKPVTNVDDGVCAFSNHDMVSLGLSCKMERAKATVFWKLSAPPYLCRIRTYTGKEIITTSEHPFFVSANGFVSSIKAEDITEGEFIASPRSLYIPGSPQALPLPRKGKRNANRPKLPLTVTPDFARFLGYLIGDGYVRKTTSYEISLTNDDAGLISDFSGVLTSYSLNTIVRKDKRNGLPTCFVFSVELGSVLEALGLVRDSFSKEVPQEVCRSENNVVREFIKAYFDCEAHVRCDSIAVVSASKLLLEQIQILLLRFGIVSQLHQTKSRATNSKNHKMTTYNRLVLCGNNARAYLSKIGFTSEKKKSSGRLLLGKKPNPNLDVIPNIGQLLKETRGALGMSQFDCGVPRSTYQHFERGDRNPSRATLVEIICSFKLKYGEICGALGNVASELVAAKLSAIETLSKSDIFWDRIVLKEKISPPSDCVYDLQVDSLHNFVANGLIAHNTRFIQQAAEIAPKSIYVSGKSVSGVGLTVSAEKDELGDGGWTLKAGALVLASGGLAGIDEFDKIDEEDRAALHEVMESQRVSIAKAGLVAQFRAKCSIVAAANPKYGRFDQNKNLADQFDVPPTLLSRFDLIFPIVDVLDPEKDARLAQHILETHMGKFVEETQLIFDKEFLRKYIAYARRSCLPKLGNDAMERIKEFYVDMRRMGKDVGSVAITPRYLEGLVRLSEANAKMRLSPIVEGKDADAAINLMKYVMKQIMTDKATGVFDVDTVATGKPKSEREKLQKYDVILDIIRAILKTQDSAEVERVIQEAASYDIDEPTARRIISELLRKGDIYEREHGHIKLVGERG